MDENKDVMTTEEVNGEIEEMAADSGWSGFGLALLIGSGLTLAAVAGVKKAKKVWANHKAKKQFEAEVEFEVCDSQDEVDFESEEETK